MGTIDEINRLQEEGMDDEQIKNSLKRRGVSSGEIENAFSQSAIKGAVVETQGNNLQFNPQTNEYSAQTSAYEGMEQSMVSPQQGGEQQVYSSQEVGQEGYSGVDSYSSYPSYQPYQETISSDIVTEISEQVVNDKLSVLHDKMEKALDFRTVAEAKIGAIR